MSYFAIFFITFGTLIIAYPEFLAYIIGFFFLFLGVNSLIMSLILLRRRNGTSDSKWSFGNYEIIRKK